MRGKYRNGSNQYVYLNDQPAHRREIPVLHMPVVPFFPLTRARAGNTIPNVEPGPVQAINPREHGKCYLESCGRELITQQPARAQEIPHQRTIDWLRFSSTHASVGNTC
jgi:hypothetical protein